MSDTPEKIGGMKLLTVDEMRERFPLPSTPETDALDDAIAPDTKGQEDWRAAYFSMLNVARSLEGRLHKAHDMCDRYAEQLQEAQREHGETLVEYELEMSELRKLLTHGVAHIRAWHGMNLPEDQEPALWEIYWNNAPEMKALRAALAEKGKP